MPINLKAAPLQISKSLIGYKENGALTSGNGNAAEMTMTPTDDIIFRTAANGTANVAFSPKTILHISPPQTYLVLF